MSDCTHANREYEGQYTREYPTGTWTLVQTWTCRSCHTHTIRRYLMHVEPDYIEEDFVHGPNNRLISAGVRGRESA